MEQNLTVGRDEDGRFFMYSNEKAYDMQLTDIAITKGTGRLDERSDLTIHVRNNEASDYVSNLYLIPFYLGHITPEEYETAPTLAEGTKMTCGAYIPAGGEADVTFSFVPEYGGTVTICAYTMTQFIGKLTLELNNDTLTNYDAYLENKSYLSRDGDQWYWNVELADRIGVRMPHWIPSDSIGLKARLFWDYEMVDSIFIRDEIREYLSLLPEKGGNGNYTFSYRMPIEIRPDCEIGMDSYLGEWINNRVIQHCCYHDYLFQYTDLTIVESANALQDNEPYYDLMGRPINGVPKEKGMYIKGNRKVYIK